MPTLPSPKLAAARRTRCIPQTASQGKSQFHRIRPEGVRGSLHSAAASGNVADIQRLLAGGAAVNRTTLGGVAPLHMAAHYGHAEAIARLLAARAEVNQLAPGGTTALCQGCIGALFCR